MNYTYYRRYQKPRRKRTQFKSFFWFVFILVLLAIGISACVRTVNNRAEERRDEAVLSVQRGEVEFLSFGQENWKDAADSQIFLEGDSVRTQEDSWATLEFHNGAQVRLANNTELIFTEVITDGLDDFIVLDLEFGRVWLNQVPKEQGEFTVQIRTDVINMSALSGEALMTNAMNAEGVYVFDGQVSMELVERDSAGGKDSVIERFFLEEGFKTELFVEDVSKLLNRMNITLFEEFTDREFGTSEFLAWNLGETLVGELLDGDEGFEEEIPEEDEEVLEEEDAVEEEEAEEPEEIEGEEPTVEEVLTISVLSPATGSIIEKDAIAIEGVISSGEASRVSVTWSGSGQAYDLGLFEAGSESFRYVADVEYGNYALGENTYTIVAYDAVGQPSNTVKLTLVAEF
jgi:hypothetical protein